ncbi:DUF2752 domain-containing protein [Lacrimispora sp. JR3]|uniref:DUF2752 domain-containing protein n=1 Tax=Lacrimispora sinapis TaxID=3111456 RepID=UPI0037489595
MDRTKYINAEKKHKRTNVGFSVLILSLFAVYCAVMYAMTGGLCALKGLIGIPCPGCGGTRALLHLARGDISGCIELNPSAPLIFLCLLNQIRVNYFNRGNKQLAGILLFVSVVIALVLYLIRMKLYFPYREPYVFYDNSLLCRILRALQIK